MIKGGNMIAQKATEAINMAVCYELQNIVKDHGAVYNSGHEAYAILKEEKEEAAESLELFESHFKTIWEGLKVNILCTTDIYQARQAALALAEEAVQCVAVCDKFIETLGGINCDKK